MANGTAKLDVEKFLKDNNVCEGWRKLILDHKEVRDSLNEDSSDDDKECIKRILRKPNIAPHTSQILHAFALCRPENVKVIVIGGGPSVQYCMENGLSFSANRTESGCYGEKGSEILEVHKALKEVQILEQNHDYYCGHEEWARKGVLLLNATLTMETGHAKSYQKSKRVEHFYLWRHFLATLLSKWILEKDLENEVMVMHLNNEMAEMLWRDISSAVKEEAAKKEDEIEKETIMAKIAKFTELSDTNLKKNFDEMLKKCPSQYKEIFKINNGYPHNDVEQFLIDNSVKKGWKDLILGSDKLKNILQGIIGDIHHVQSLWDPPADKILRAFAYCEPKDIKVIIIGTSPVTRKEKANGLSFSCNKIDNELGNRGAIYEVHNALRVVGILAKSTNYYCGHEEWAKNGVLLLNAALTIPEGKDFPDEMKEHCEKWRPFLVELLNSYVQQYPQQEQGRTIPIMI